ncbi:MAG: hypothetical protein ACLGH4_02530 [Actinomycetes bacterium]
MTAPRLRLVALAAAAGLVLGGCSGGGDPDAEESPTATNDASASESPTADVTVPEGVEVTAQGSDLEFGDSAAVAFEPDQKRGTVLGLTVTSARKGRLKDFKGFILDDPYKRKANYYYVEVSVENLGEGDVGGAPVPLWGVNGENTLLPAVNFTTEFDQCASTPLPKRFEPGDSIDTCLVYLSPDKGSLEAVSFRPDQAFDPIEWTGEIQPPAKDEKDKKKNKKGNRG